MLYFMALSLPENCYLMDWGDSKRRISKNLDLYSEKWGMSLYSENRNECGIKFIGLKKPQNFALASLLDF